MSFCESEDIELLVMGTRSGNKIRKKLRCGRGELMGGQIWCGHWTGKGSADVAAVGCVIALL